MKLKFITLAITSLAAALSAAAENQYIPKIGGVIRARYEQSFEDGRSRFQVRNARVNLTGRIANPIEYYLQADLCDRGSMKFLDGWVRFTPLDGFKIQAGQFRMPFGTDTFRGPANYIFSNRSFIGRDLCNYRAVGLQLSYTLPRFPLTVQAGMFNPGTITDHTPWTHDKAYSGKATAKFGDFSISAGAMSVIPDSVRMNLLGASVTYTHGRFLAEAEYLNEHYTGDQFNTCHGVNVFADYHMPVKWGVFNQFSTQARFDVRTAYSNGIPDDANILTTTAPPARRITIGATLSYLKLPLRCDLRLNIEKYFYSQEYISTERGDKLCAEIILKF